MLDEILGKESHKLATVQEKNEDGLLEMANVVGVSIGHKITNGIESDEQVLSVLVSNKMDTDLLDKDHVIPKKIGDFNTDVVEVGEIFAGKFVSETTEVETATEEVQEYIETYIGPTYSPHLRRRMRPAPGGYSVGHYKGGTGTIATGCYDTKYFPGKPRHYYILSNNHVLANANMAKIGDAILQPGRADGGQYPRDVIGRLSRFIPIRFISGKDMPCNYVDAAIAETDLQDINREVFWSGEVKRLYQAPKVGDIVQKAGRTTGFTTGRVTNINATVIVNYSQGKKAKFCRQIITTNMSDPGDSGSLVMNRDEGAVGLLFAGSSAATIINHVHFVQTLLKIRITEK